MKRDVPPALVVCPSCNGDGTSHAGVSLTGSWGGACSTCQGTGRVKPDTRSRLHRTWDATWDAIWMGIVFLVWLGFLLAMFGLPIGR